MFLIRHPLYLIHEEVVKIPTTHTTHTIVIHLPLQQMVWGMLVEMYRLIYGIKIA